MSELTSPPGRTKILSKKVGPFPVGVWLLIAAGGLGIGLYLRRKSGGGIVAQDTQDIAEYVGIGGGGGITDEPPPEPPPAPTPIPPPTSIHNNCDLKYPYLNARWMTAKGLNPKRDINEWIRAYNAEIPGKRHYTTADVYATWGPCPGTPNKAAAMLPDPTKRRTMA